jgi:hypothetical protein
MKFDRWAFSIVRLGPIFTGLFRSSFLFLVLFPVLSTAFCALGGPAALEAQTAPLQTLAHHVRPQVANHQTALLGAAPDDQVIHASIVLPLRNQPALTDLLVRLYDPKSTQYRQFLTVSQFTEQFGPTQSDFDAVVAFARSNGFTVDELPANRLIVPFSGTVAQVDAAFNLQVNLYQDPVANRTFFSPDREPSLALSVPVAHISGLNNYSVPHPMVAHRDLTGAEVTALNGSGPGGSYLGSDMRAAYYGAGTLTGTGQAVGLLEFGGYSISDVNLTFQNAGQTYNVPVNNVLLDGATGASNGSDAEEVLDIVQAIGMAPNLSQVRVYVGSGLDDPHILNAMVSENLAAQLSCSWSWVPDDPSVDDPFFQEMAAQGQSFFTASGDDGAFDSAISPYFYPAEDQYVTAVGGTHLTTTGPAGNWVSETVWNSQRSGSGGGISPDGIGLPSWQYGLANSANGGSSTVRNVPDVAMEGDFDNYSCARGLCSGGYAGTSFAAPRWAGFMALVNQQAVEAGNAPAGGLGFMNPAFYRIAQAAASAGDFHDVTSGNNDTYNQPVYFNATPGYDLTTGWGSANGQALINDLAGPQVPGFWIATAQGTIVLNPGSTSTATFSITDAGGFTGAVTLAVTSALPAGVTASFSPDPATGKSVLTLSATAAVQNSTQTITVTGTAGALTASTNFTLTVHTPSFTLLAAPSALGVSQGATGTATISVEPLYNFAGAVNLSISGLPAGVTAAFSPASATSNSTLTLTVSSTAAAGASVLTVTGVSGSVTANTTLTLTIHAPAFSLTASSQVSVGLGQSANASVSVTDLYGFAGNVSLAVSGLPSGVSAFFTPSTTTSFSTLTFVASNTAATGQSTVTITGTSGALTASTTLTLGVFAPTFLLSAPSTQAVGQGNSSTTTVSVNSEYGFTGSVHLAISGLPSGVTASFSPNPTTGSSQLTFTAASNAPIGQSVVTITGTSGSTTATTTLVLGVYAPAFTLSSTSTVNVGQNSTATGYVFVNDEYGFNGSVTFSVSGLPSGVTASLTPNPATGTAVITFTASSSAATGAANVTITGTSGTLTASTVVNLGVFAPTFKLFSPSTLTLGLGESSQGTVTVSPSYGFIGAVNLSVSGLPSGVTASFSPNPATNGSSTVTFTANATAPVGTNTITITGTSGGTSVTTTTSLTIGSPTFTILSSSVTVGQGSTATSTVSVSSQYGFTGIVNLAVSGLPAGVTAAFAANPTTGNTSVVFTAASTAAVGNTTITITGTSGAIQSSTTVVLSVLQPTFQLGATTSVSVGQGASSQAYLYVTNQYGFNGNVSFSATGLPSGVTLSFGPSSGTTVLMTFTASSSAAVGQSTITITGVSGSTSASTQLTLSVYAPTFTLSGASSATVAQGGSVLTQVSVEPEYGFSGKVTFTASGLPSGVTAMWSPNPTTGTAYLTLAATSAVPVGTYNVTITGVSGNTSVTSALTLSVVAASFTLSSGQTVVVGQGSSATLYLLATPQNGFSGPVSFSVSGLPNGVTASFNPSSGTISGSSSLQTALTLSASSTAALGELNVLVSATSGSQTVTTLVNLTVYAPTFTLSTYSTLTLNPGSTTSGTVSVSPLYGFTGTVALSISGLPNGVTAAFSPNPNTGGYSTLSLSATSAAAQGQYTLTITGTSGGQTVTTTASLLVAPASFTVTGSPSAITVGQGYSAAFNTYVNAVNGFSGNVTFSVSGLPSGVTGAFSANPTSYESSLTVTATSSAPVGIYNITITGTSGSLSSSVVVPLTVSTPAFSLTGTSPITASQSGSTTGSVSISAQNGFTGSVNLSISGLPSGVTASFSSNPTNYFSQYTLTVSPSAPIGTSTITITGVSGSQTQTTTFLLTVVPAAFILTAPSPGTVLNQGGTATTYVSINGQNGFTGNITLSASGLPSGVSVAFATNPYNSTLTFSASSTASPGTATVTITGTYGSASSSTTLQITVLANGFTVAALPPELEVLAGGSETAIISVVPANGFTGSVNFAVSGLPSGLSASFGTNPTTSASNLRFTAAPAIAPGVYPITVTGTYAALTASAQISVTVPSNAAATATTLALTAAGAPVSTVVAGTRVTATATVMAGSTPVTRGQVNFCSAATTVCDTAHMAGSAQLTNSGTATAAFVPGPGVRSYQAVYVGTSSNATSISPAATLSVTAALPTVTTIAQSGSAGNYTLAATVTGQGPAPPTGTVAFVDTSDGNFQFGSATLSGAAGTLALNAGQTTPISLSQAAIVTADFNGDGIPDLAAPNYSANKANILLGNGDGTFTAAASLPSVGPTGIAAGDFNRDGVPDLAIASQTTGALNIYLGNGDGTFTESTLSPQVSVNPIAVIPADFNRDGLLDLAVVSDGTVTILLGNGDGTFTQATSFAVILAAPSIVAGDFNGDGIPDLAMVVSASQGYNITSVSLFLGAGDGTFGPANTVDETTLYYPSSIAAGDLNGDGKLDIALTLGTGTIAVLLGNGDGTFNPTPGQAINSVGNALAIGDFNGDGKADLASVSFYGAGALSVLLGNGDGTFGKLLAFAGSSGAAAISVGDWNGDGTQDLAVVNSNTSMLNILTAQVTQKATASASGIAPVGQGQRAVAASYPGNSIYAPSLSATTTLSAAAGAPALSFAPSPASTTTTQALTVTVAVNGGSANPAPTGSVRLSSGSYSSAPGTLSGGSAAITIPAGALALGTDSLTATYTPDTASSSIFTSATGSAPVIVTAGAPTITWATPAPIVVGTALSSLQLNATASVPGTFVYTPSAGFVPPVGTEILMATFTPSDPIDYTSASALVTLIVNPIPNTIWTLNSNGSLSALTQSGTAAFPVGPAGGGQGLTIDSNGNLWSLNQSTSTLAKFSRMASAILYTPYTGGGLNSPAALTIDGAGILWIANGNNTISAFSGTGIPVTTVPFSVAVPTPTSINVDSSGNLWVTNAGDNSVTEIIGAATPVVTPTVVGVKNSTLATKP